MTRQEYYKIREKIGIKQQVQTFLKYVMDMCEIYPQFNQMTLDEYLNILIRKNWLGGRNPKGLKMKMDGPIN